jgi:hypothetical protein
VAVTFFGKWKTALQIVGISLMLYEQPMLGLPVYPIGMELLLVAAALTLYAQRPDKEWGLTDCASFLIMQERGITEALVYDDHFHQAGFIPLLRDR